MASSGATTSRTLLDIVPQYPKTKLEVGSVRLKSIVTVGPLQSTTSRFPKLEECAHFHYDHVDLQPIQLNVIDEDSVKSDLDGITIRVTSGVDSWQIRRTYEHFCKLDEQLHQCVFDRKFSDLPSLSAASPRTQADTQVLLDKYVKRLSAIGSGCAISCGPVLSWFELDNRGRRLVAAGHGINTPAVAAAFATTPYTAHATDELSFQIGDMISVIDMPPAEESSWWRGKRGFLVGFFPSNCVAVITDKIPNEIALAEPSKPVLRKHGKLIAFFRAFILSRPSRRRLKQSGILKERVFGCDLSEHLLNSGRDIPLVLKCCAEFIEAYGIVDGIYRLSGVTSNIQRLRSVFDEDRVPVLAEDSVIKQDIHGVASLLKMYFRELPNPLCTYQLYDEFVAAVQSPHDQRLENMKKTVQKLPPPHYRTLEYLMGHLGRVCGHSRGTGMTARNVAIVWAPNLLRCRSLDQGVAALQGVGVQAVVTEFLILYSPLIFNNQPIDGAHVRPKSLAVCSPTKLLTLQEAQARSRRHSPSQIIVTEISEKDSSEPNYHTVIELPRKRQPFPNWRTIFTPRRNHQVKSPRRFKRKSVVKSAEFLGAASNMGNNCAMQNSGPPTSTHSRSVSHDSYFDTAIDHHSSSSLVETQHEGLSLSLDLSELQMNFDIEESEMRIFSEDETNQLFSSGASIVFGALEQELDLEQRFSNQELRYIDSYSPDPMEGSGLDSPSTPGYQPLTTHSPTPTSYENLRVKAEFSYENLRESPSVGQNELRKKENDFYEPCADPPPNPNVYECMELENECYEPVTCAVQVHYENTANNEPNIYEEVQFTQNDIYEQVSNFRNSVNEVNQLVTDDLSEKPTAINCPDAPPVGSESVDEEHHLKTETHDNTPMDFDDKCEVTLPKKDSQSVQLEVQIEETTKVPEDGILKRLSFDGNYANVNSTVGKPSEPQMTETVPNLNDNLECDSKLSRSEIRDDKLSCVVVSEVLKEVKPVPPNSLPLKKTVDTTFDPAKSPSPLKTPEAESDAERRERIEKYKEERRNFFRNKYKTENLNNNEERDEELIRRIKQKTKFKENRDSVSESSVRARTSGEFQMKKSPTKVTVSISYSPTKSRAPLELDGTPNPELDDDADSKQSF